MPKTCESCQFYAADNSLAVCPQCGTALRFTMLPPPVEPGTEPLRIAATSERSRGFSLGLGNIWENMIGSQIGLVVLFVLGLAASWVIYDWVMESRGPGLDMSDRVKVGMHFSEVGRVLDVEPAPKPSYPRMRDSFPADEFGNGRLDYEGHGVRLKVHFIGGYVTSVEEWPSKLGPGFHKYQFVITER